MVLEPGDPDQQQHGNPGDDEAVRQGRNVGQWLRWMKSVTYPSSGEPVHQVQSRSAADDHQAERDRK